MFAGGHIGDHNSSWRAIAAAVHDARNTTVGVLPPTITILNHVECAIRPKLHVDGAAQIPVSHKGLQCRPLSAKVSHLNPVAHPFINKEMSIQFSGQSNGRFVFLIKMIHRSSHDRAPASAQAGETCALQVAIPNQRQLRRRQILETRVVRGGILRRTRLVGAYHLVVVKIINGIRLIGPNKKRPTEVACPGCGVDFVITVGLDVQFRHHIGAHVPKIECARRIIHRHAKGIAHAHCINLRTTPFRVCKKIALGDLIATAGLWLDA